MVPIVRPTTSRYRTLVRQLLALHDAPAEAILASCSSTTSSTSTSAASATTTAATTTTTTTQLAPLGDRCVQLPATSATLRELHTAMVAAAKSKGVAGAVARAGPVTAELDPALDALIARMAPLDVASLRAQVLGLPVNPPLQRIVEEYIEDFVLLLPKK